LAPPTAGYEIDMKILVTGAAGFIGMQRVIHLAAQAGVRDSLTNPRAYTDLAGLHMKLFIRGGSSSARLTTRERK
jgi:hypothetical protein